MAQLNFKIQLSLLCHNRKKTDIKNEEDDHYIR